MSSGLGLGNLVGVSPPSPPPSAPSTLPTPSAQRRPALIRKESTPQVARTGTGQPLLSPKDIHVIFCNLDEVASLAEAFSGVLDGAWSHASEERMDDQVGDAFLEMVGSFFSPYILSPLMPFLPPDSQNSARLLYLLCEA